MMLSSHSSFTPAARNLSAATLAVALGLSLSGCVTSDVDGESADDFPSSTIQMIVPWSAGGGTDLMTRKLASLAEKTCGARIIVSNQTGAAGATGHQAMVDAKPDGYTLGTTTTEIAILKHLGGAEFTPEGVEGITQFSANPALLAVPADSPYTSFEGLLDAVKAGEQVRVATNGRGGTWDMAARGLGLETGVPFTDYVPFNGASEMIPAVLGGHVEALSPSAGELLQQIDGGGLRGLAIMSDERFPALPDVPTLKELGVDWSLSSWIGVVAPAGTPADRVAVLDDCFGEAATSDEFHTFMTDQGNGIKNRDAAEFEAFMDEEYLRFETLISELYG